MKIAFLTDIHIGADGSGYHQQTPYINGYRDLLVAFDEVIKEESIDLVIYGGDLSDHGLATEMVAGFDAFYRLSAPVLMVSGNKDCSTDEAILKWREIGQKYNDRITLADTHLEFDECDIYALNNKYITPDGIKAEWVKGYVETFTDEQLSWLEAGLSKFKDRTAIVVMHHGMEGLMPEVTGQPEIIVGPLGDYAQRMNSLLAKYPHCRIVLSGHCHGTSAYGHDMRVNLTTSAFSEAPYEFRLLEVREKVVAVKMVSVADRLGDVPGPIEGKAWVNGRRIDREFLLPVCDDC